MILLFTSSEKVQECVSFIPVLSLHLFFHLLCLLHSVSLFLLHSLLFIHIQQSIIF